MLSGTTTKNRHTPRNITKRDANVIIVSWLLSINPIYLAVVAKIEEIKLIVSKQIQVGKNEIKTNLRAHGKVVSGRTPQKPESETTNTPTTVTGRIWSTVSYFPAMERGRGPFKGGAERGLSERLYSWSKLKGLSFQTDTQRWAFSYALWGK